MLRQEIIHFPLTNLFVYIISFAPQDWLREGLFFLFCFFHSLVSRIWSHGAPAQEIYGQSHRYESQPTPCRRRGRQQGQQQIGSPGWERTCSVHLHCPSPRPAGPGGTDLSTGGCGRAQPCLPFSHLHVLLLAQCQGTLKTRMRG